VSIITHNARTTQVTLQLKVSCPFIQRLVYKKIEMGYANVTIKSVMMQIAQLAQKDSFSTFVKRILKKISLILFILHWLYVSSQIALTG
jgi:hypothetical protein